MTITRRRFLSNTAALGGLAIAHSAAKPLAAFASSFSATQQKHYYGIGYGPIAPVAQGHLSLPSGFSYTIIDQEGDQMSDGNKVPSYPDGAAIVSHPTNPKLWRLVRNQELRKAGRAIGDASKAYDSFGRSCMTCIDFDKHTFQVTNSFVLASGFDVACSGGLTPRNTWFLGEESVNGLRQGFTKKHGYIFEIDTQVSSQIVDPVPNVSMGRMIHEAAVTDPATGIVYLTEDQGENDGFYRFIPTNVARPADGGVLQMLGVMGRPKADLRTNQRVGVEYTATWHTIADPDPADADRNPSAVFEQGYSQGAAVFVTNEGCALREGSIVFVSSKGGNDKNGQIWEYNTLNNKLKLVYESYDMSLLDGPDGCAVSPRGGLVLCEDSSNGNFLRGFNRNNEIFTFAKNLVSDDEFAGATFTPDGEVLVVSIQKPGITFAITGPWGEGGL